MDWIAQLQQYPTLLIAGGLCYYLYNEIEKKNAQIVSLQIKSTEAISKNTQVLEELVILINKVTNNK
jgi:O-methyltransferase involved in polyketide biosynthesis